MKERILIAEDDAAIRTGVSDLLESEGYHVASAADGVAALEMYRDFDPDLVILDVMMPGMNGYDVCREIRTGDRVTPVIMLTAKGREVDKVVGLELGADDYMVKPFGMDELLARVRSALRRGALSRANRGRDAGHLSFGDVRVDFDRMTGCKGDAEFPLTPKEAALLRCLADNEGRVLSRADLLDEVWGIDCDVTTRTVDQHVVRLRQKIEDDPSRPRFLCTVHGAGYRFDRFGKGL
ncbi:MAG: response regulator transcription factor [Synergistota bacterium]|jgi:DNA-binding response OmpR family regulator|nr:response regulator transcription factor [Synergistota bacterium]OPZ39665.1 MAG: Alkaline phosphatase synthesis transcriptional regulatory protein PhoP [Synergistetes bacterium ADurb.BinA166]